MTYSIFAYSCGPNKVRHTQLYAGAFLTEKESSSGRASFYFSQDSSDPVSRFQVPAFVRGGRGAGPICEKPTRRRKGFIDEDAAHVSHTGVAQEKIFRRRTGNDEPNFAQSV